MRPEYLARLNAAIRTAMPRDPRYRYWETADQWQFHYTTEAMGDGKYASAVYAPHGKGARSGKAMTWKVRQEVHHRTRRAAKARAYRLFVAHRDRVLATDGPVLRP